MPRFKLPSGVVIDTDHPSTVSKLRYMTGVVEEPTHEAPAVQEPEETVPTEQAKNVEDAVPAEEAKPAPATRARQAKKDPPTPADQAR